MLLINNRWPVGGSSVRFYSMQMSRFPDLIRKYYASNTQSRNRSGTIRLPLRVRTKYTGNETIFPLPIALFHPNGFSISQPEFGAGGNEHISYSRSGSISFSPEKGRYIFGTINYPGESRMNPPKARIIKSC